MTFSDLLATIPPAFSVGGTHGTLWTRDRREERARLVARYFHGRTLHERISRNGGDVGRTIRKWPAVKRQQKKRIRHSAMSRADKRFFIQRLD